MKIAITGARGSVGREVVRVCAEAGHDTIHINRSPEEPDGTPRSEVRTADVAGDYDAFVRALKGCDALIHLAALPDPVGKADHVVFSNNVLAAFNGFRAAAEVGITRVCYASSVNAIGLAFATQPLKFPYFPIEEESYPCNPTDSYALSKQEAEVAAKAFVNWFPGMRIACMRIHNVGARKDVAEEHAKDWEGTAVKELWGWVNPTATARACLMSVWDDESVAKGEKWAGCEIFNIVAPTTTQDDKSSEQLAKKYYPDAELRGDFKGHRGFWATDKARKLLGWTHHEKE
ncbi:putative UDP-galactose 4-epimerase [Microdochium trichocladiopsis]|uniref:UDP-galactose 4-epimerase n=1 Tax=Microdochium trichocladiopsis TaxID=1682393 RepID=A0A9P8YIU9_9PEZI|nr:putative UDP-galactose 4-epimerase [Microdochium trichocladiopsis]KAH7040728.1 putative UDP-galactose 4-epimerase [Microdochium trichocladiopsis]